MESLKEVRVLSNDKTQGVTTVELTTNKTTYKVALGFKPSTKPSHRYGVVYNYSRSVADFLKEKNIDCEEYDKSDYKDILPDDRRKTIFDISFYNAG